MIHVSAQKRRHGVGPIATSEGMTKSRRTYYDTSGPAGKKRRQHAVWGGVLRLSVLLGSWFSLFHIQGSNPFIWLLTEPSIIPCVVTCVCLTTDTLVLLFCLLQLRVSTMMIIVLDSTLYPCFLQIDKFYIAYIGNLMMVSTTMCRRIE